MPSDQQHGRVAHYKSLWNDLGWQGQAFILWVAILESLMILWIAHLTNQDAVSAVGHEVWLITAVEYGAMISAGFYGLLFAVSFGPSGKRGKP